MIRLTSTRIPALLLTTILAGVAAGEERTILMVPKGAPLAEASLSAAESLGAVRLVERADHLIVEMDAARYKDVARRAGLFPVDHFGRIELQRRTIRTDLGGPVSEASPAGGLKIVQFHAPRTTEERGAFLRATSARIVHALPHNALLVWVPEESARGLAGGKALAEHSVRHVTDFAASDAIPTSLDSDRAWDEPAPYVLTFYTGEGAALVADLEWLAARQSVRFLAEAEFNLLPDRAIVSVELPGSMLDEVAARPTLLAVTRHGQMQVAGEASALAVANQVKTVAGKIVPKGPVADGVTYKGWLDSKLAYPGFDRTNPLNYPVVAVVDTGVDNGNPTSPTSLDFRRIGQSGQASRIAFGFEWNFDDNIPNFSVVGGDNHGHAVASILTGYNNNTTSSFADTATGFRYGVGVSPYGRVGNVKWNLAQQPIGPLYLDLNGMILHSRERIFELGHSTPSKAAVSTNSWIVVRTPEPCDAPPGDPQLAVYDILAQILDSRTRDSIEDYWEQYYFNPLGNPGYVPRFAGKDETLFVFAAGNGGWLPADFDVYDCCPGGPGGSQTCNAVPRMNTINDPGLAKNTLVVGASEAVDHLGLTPPHCFVNPGDCCQTILLNGLGHADNLNDVAYYSAKGTPERAKRIKPDIIAPGMGTLVNALEPEIGCVSDPALIVSSPPYPIYKRLALGTSFSTPHAAGMAQLAAVHLGQEYGLSSPSPALLKAWLLNPTIFVTGAHSGPHGSNGNLISPASLPSPYQGFGRANLGEVIDSSVPRHVIDQSHVFSSIGQPFSISGSVAVTGEPLLVTMVWTDCFGSSAAPKWQNLVNDLDLYLVYNPTGSPSYYVGNLMSGETSRKAKVFDIDPEPEIRGGTARRIHTDENRAHRLSAGVYSQLRAVGDKANPVEKIAVRSGTTAGQSVEVIVYPWILDGDGLDQDPSGTPRQDFAIVIHNFIPTP